MILQWLCQYVSYLNILLHHYHSILSSDLFLFSYAMRFSWCKEIDMLSLLNHLVSLLQYMA